MKKVIDSYRDQKNVYIIWWDDEENKWLQTSIDETNEMRFNLEEWEHPVFEKGMMIIKRREDADSSDKS